jgi:hypothetical protein
MRGRLVDKAGPPALAKHRGVNTALRPLVEQKSLCDSLSHSKVDLASKAKSALSQSIAGLRALGLTDSEIRIAFTQVMRE